MLPRWAEMDRSRACWSLASFWYSSWWTMAMSHSFQPRGINITTPHTTISTRVRWRMDRLEWVPRVALVGAPVQLMPCS